MEENVAITLLKEFREFRVENEKRWEENNKRWDENDRRWKENDRRWDENTKTIKELSKRIDEVDRNTNERIDNLEKVIKKDRVDLAGILETMQKSITEQFKKQQEYMDIKFEKIFAAQRENEIEHQKFKQLLYNHESRLNLQNSRIDSFEQWKEQFDMGEFTAI